MGSVTITLDPDQVLNDASGLRPIGATPIATSVTLMRLRSDPTADGGYVFDREVPATFGPFRRFLENRDGKRFGWLRLEAKGGKQIAEGDCLICAEDPYSSYWVGAARFKGPNHKGRAKLNLAHLPTADAAATWIADQPTDFWESGSAVTAGIMQDFDRVHRDAAQTVRRSARYVLGLCPNTGGKASEEVAVDAIFRSDKVRTLLDLTARGEIRFVFRGQSAVLKPQLRDEASSLMFLSIQQALAGPSDDSDQFVGRAVVDLVDRLYRDHLNNLNRHSAEDDINFVSFDDPKMGQWELRQAQQFHNLDRSGE